MAGWASEWVFTWLLALFVDFILSACKMYPNKNEWVNDQRVYAKYRNLIALFQLGNGFMRKRDGDMSGWMGGPLKCQSFSSLTRDLKQLPNDRDVMLWTHVWQAIESKECWRVARRDKLTQLLRVNKPTIRHHHHLWMTKDGRLSSNRFKMSS